MSDPVAALLAAAQAGQPVPSEAFDADAVLDATVPNWRFTCRGGEGVRAQLARWYADPGEFESLSRTPIPGGELVEFVLTWTEGGVPFAAHQVHVIEIVEGRITKDTVFCGGRWDAGLLAEMEEASHALA
jgi:hypothetical protein